MITVRDPEEPVTAEQISEAARRLGCEFPAEYVSFLLQHNGGQPSPSTFPVSKSGKSRVNNLLSVIAQSTPGKESFDLVEINLWKRQQGEMPSDVVQIGYDSFGNGICLGVAGKLRGGVFFLDHEELEGQALAERFWKIADTFAEFLESLEPSPEDV